MAVADHQSAVRTPQAWSTTSRYASARVQLTTSAWASGRVADAVAAYHRARRIRDERLGTAPGPASRAACERVSHSIPDG
ncbi:BTAD domain-containing putative transcriptional regulator [Amycolatopsis sp. lyj-23]|uniref:BTAD domain-containing putative transcriptional regulator n=1 Tax=Amycolatopsis sp. lyj-23 TaxID=2789283 RepID=UPI00397CA1FF